MTNAELAGIRALTESWSRNAQADPIEATLAATAVVAVLWDAGLTIAPREAKPLAEPTTPVNAKGGGA